MWKNPQKSTLKFLMETLFFNILITDIKVFQNMIIKVLKKSWCQLRMLNKKWAFPLKILKLIVRVLPHRIPDKMGVIVWCICWNPTTFVKHFSNKPIIFEVISCFRTFNTHTYARTHARTHTYKIIYVYKCIIFYICTYMCIEI